ncbi:MAG TPA: hypothetical protein VFB58_13030 [Chloroflexota bacterium]|nr:hypothetical protein [Chloroflexota bacterium]
MTFIAVSVVSAHLEETHKRWKLESFADDGGSVPVVVDERFAEKVRRQLATLTWKKEGYRFLPADSAILGPTFHDPTSFGGLMYLLDLDTGCEVWRSHWEPYIATPSGFCLDGDRMYVADLEGSHIFEVDLANRPGTIVRRISHPALNDIHYVVRTRRGLLVASTGTDMVIELDLDGNSLYEWWAGDYGYTTTRGGLERRPEKGVEHRDQYYHTRFQTTHLNAVRYRDPEERLLLVLLWEQGCLIEIDTSLPPEHQQPRVVLDGLYHPHSIRPLWGGSILVVNSQGEELIVLDRHLEVVRRVPSVPGWIQDAVDVGPDRWLVADVNRFRLLLQDDAGREIREIPFDPDWRVYGMEVVPDEAARRLTGVRRDAYASSLAAF